MRLITLRNSTNHQVPCYVTSHTILLLHLSHALIFSYEHEVTHTLQLIFSGSSYGGDM